MTKVSEITQQNKEILQSICSDEERFGVYLDVLAQHTAMRRRENNLSALSCAALAVSGYSPKDTAEAMTADEWSRIDASARPKPDAFGIPVIKSSSTGKHFRVDEIFPACAMDNLPDDYFHGYASRIDLNDNVDRAAWNKAVGELTVVDRATGDVVPFDIATADPNLRYVVMRHFGIEPGEGIEPVVPDPGLVNDLKGLKEYCDGLKATAGRICNQIQETYSAEIRAYEGVDRTEAVDRTEQRDRASSHAAKLARDPAHDRSQRPFVAAGQAPIDVAQAASRAAAQSARQQDGAAIEPIM